MNLNNLRVGVRLGIAFGAILLITVMIAAQGVWRLGTLKAASHELATVELERSDLPQKWTSDIKLNWVRTSAALNAPDPASTLIDKAGVTMTEVVDSIKRVTDIMGEITVASSEQSTAVSQVSEAVQQMDHVTQQNSALVEEMAAAASSLRAQAKALVDAVAFFSLSALR